MELANSKTQGLKNTESRGLKNKGLESQSHRRPESQEANEHRRTDSQGSKAASPDVLDGTDHRPTGEEEDDQMELTIGPLSGGGVWN